MIQSSHSLKYVEVYNHVGFYRLFILSASPPPLHSPEMLSLCCLEFKVVSARPENGFSSVFAVLVVLCVAAYGLSTLE
jgi:hypothetical protein